MSASAPILPDHILRLMSPDDRRALGKAGRIASECAERAAVKSERAEQRLFSSWLSLRAIPYVTPRADKKSTIAQGWPDFSIFYNAKAYFVEMKSLAGKVSPEQDECHKALIKAGFKVDICYDAAQAIEGTRRFFGI